MRKVHFLPLVFSFVCATLFSDKVIGQRLNTEALESLVDEWNFAINTRSIQSFQKVYGDRISINDQRLTKSSAIAMKVRSFKEHPDFKQRIITVITYSSLKDGLIRCDFEKEVRLNGKWRRMPSYLLVRYEAGSYRIVGEMENTTAETVPLSRDVDVDTTEHSIPKQDTAREDDPDIITTSAPESEPLDSVAIRRDDAGIPSILDNFVSTEVITIQKRYVFILIGMLTVGGLMIFIADSIRGGKRRNRMTVNRYNEAAQATRLLRAKSVFEDFVITLFDPLLFQYRQLRAPRVSDGRVVEGERGPDFEIEFNHKGVRAKFGIKCQYYPDHDTREVKLFSPSQHQVIRDFENERGMKVYYVLGFGGKPDDPKQLFLLRSDDVRSEFVSKQTLRHYSKSGMFFFNGTTGRLQ